MSLSNEREWFCKDEYWYEDENDVEQPRWAQMIDEAARRGRIEAWADAYRIANVQRDYPSKEWLLDQIAAKLHQEDNRK